MKRRKTGAVKHRDALYGLIGALLITIILVGLVFFQEEPVVPVKRVEFRMGTVVTIIVYDTLERGEDAIDAAMEAIDEVSLAASTYDEKAEAYLLNEQGHLDSPSDHLLDILNRSVEYYNLTGGIFDITVKPLLDLWSFKQWPGAHHLFDLPAGRISLVENRTISPELWELFFEQGYGLTEEPLVIVTDTSGWLVIDRIATLPVSCTEYLRNGSVKDEIRDRFETRGLPLSDEAVMERTGNTRWNITDGRKKYVLETRANHVVVGVEKYGINRGAAGLNVTAQFWDLDETRQKAEIGDRKELLGTDRIEMGPDGITLPEGMEITLGGIAKGYAVDRAVEALKDKGIEHALVNAGGDIATIGRKPDGSKWVLALENPGNRKEYVARFEVDGRAVCTSGNYIRYFDPEAKVGHIIDPRTGYSADGSMSATVIAGDCMSADILATALFVMGPGEGIAFIEELPGIEGFVIDGNRTIHRSSGTCIYES